MENVKRLVKPRGHFIQDRKVEIFLGIFAFIVGCLLLYDAYDARGKKMPWPASGLSPW